MSTPQELEESAIKTFGNELGLTYYYLYNQIGFLKIKWSEYKKLYLVSKEQIDFLNSYAPFYFSVNQKIYFNDILLHIVKLTDKEKTLGHDNLSIEKLKSLIPNGKDNTEVKKAITDSLSQVKFFKEWRNKYLAHFDFYVMTNQNNNLLNEVPIEDVEKSINSLWNIIQIISKTYFNEILADDVIEQLGGATVFIKKLKGEYFRSIPSLK